MFISWSPAFVDDSSTITANFLNWARISIGRALDAAMGSEGLPYAPATPIIIAGAGLVLTTDFVVSGEAAFSGGGIVSGLAWQSSADWQFDGAALFDVVSFSGSRIEAVTSHALLIPQNEWEIDGSDANLPYRATADGADGIYWPLKVMPGATITGYGVWTDPPNIVGLPALNQRIAIHRQLLSTGAMSIVETFTDPTAVEATYEAPHLLSKSGSSIVVDGLYAYFLVYLVATGGQQTGCKVWSPRIATSGGSVV